ncbi:MAG: hypothetical protein ACKVJU_08405 [Verrucomicrobiales bacterium]
MKTIHLCILSLFAGALLTSCETQNGSDEGAYSFPSPDPSRTAAELQNTHNQLRRQNL